MKQQAWAWALTVGLSLAILNPAQGAENMTPPPSGGDHSHAPTAPEGDDRVDIQEQMKRMQDEMIKMHDFMHKISSIKDPKEKERLKAEQRKLMMQHMGSMTPILMHTMMQMMSEAEAPPESGEGMGMGGGAENMEMMPPHGTAPATPPDAKRH